MHHQLVLFAGRLLNCNTFSHASSFRLHPLQQQHWSVVWRQQLSYKALAERYGRERVVACTHPRARKAVAQIYLEKLDQYMQWFPWSWFSNMQFIGAGGFSAVYAAVITQPYDLEPSRIALKVVDDKILNEVFLTRSHAHIRYKYGSAY